VALANQALADHAQGLFDEAAGRGKRPIERVEADLVAFARLLVAEVRLRKALSDPALPPEAKRALLEDLGGGRLDKASVELLATLAARLLLRWLLLAYPRPRPSPFDAALAARPAPPKPPAELERLARLLALSSASALHAHTRLRPELRRVAADRLSWSRGIELDADPVAARGAVGEAAWPLVRPDPGETPDREASGVPPAVLDAAVAALERVGDR